MYSLPGRSANIDNVESLIASESLLVNTAPHKLRLPCANFGVTEPPVKFVLIETPPSASLN